MGVCVWGGCALSSTNPNKIKNKHINRHLLEIDKLKQTYTQMMMMMIFLNPKAHKNNYTENKGNHNTNIVYVLGCGFCFALEC